ARGPGAGTRGVVAEYLHPLERAIRLIVAVHEARRGAIVPVEEQAVGTSDPVRMLALAQEALPLVLARSERGQPPVEAECTPREIAGGEVRRVRAGDVGPVEGEAELVGHRPEPGGGGRLALGHVLESAEVERIAAERRAAP